MDTPFRTHTCGQIDSTLLNKELQLAGWIHRIRNHGGVCFIQLRDRYSSVQLVIDDSSPPTARHLINQLHPEYCISIKGILRRRPDSMINSELRNGMFEFHVHDLRVLSPAPTLPITIEPNHAQASEDIRLHHRYLDLRSGDMQQALLVRHLVSQAIRHYLNARHFVEIETPTLIRSTPEGARDFLVPSRLQQGMFYALPQSPQLYKQILMVSGMDRYFQLAHCYRDEDARGDRQPEHTQLDIEMSFVTQDEIFSLVEGMIAEIFEQLNTDEHIRYNSFDKHLPQFSLAQPTFRRMSYDYAMRTYGTDKPDLRIPYLIQDFSHHAVASGIPFFADIATDTTKMIACIRIPNGADLSRKHIDALAHHAQEQGAETFAWTKIKRGVFEGGIASKLQLTPSAIGQEYSLEDEDLMLFVKGVRHDYGVHKICGAIRTTAYHLVNSKHDRTHQTTNPKQLFEFVWITDFPLFEKTTDTFSSNMNKADTPYAQAWTPAHHMFTQPQEQHLEFLMQHEHPVPDYDYSQLRGMLYDLVCNGVELASGSIRIHSTELQRKVFDIVGVTHEEQESRFGFLLRALTYGAPPHGGIAPGIDRFIALLLNKDSIRDVIAFPKNSIGASPLDESPGAVTQSQLDELGITITNTSKS